VTTTPAPQISIDALPQSAIRRAFAFIFVPAVFLFLITALSESDKWWHALDDEIIVIALVATLLYFLVTRKLSTLSELTRINRIGLIASAIVVAAGVLAIVMEFSDPNDIGDDPFTIVGGVLAVINGLLVMSVIGPRAPDEAAGYGVEWSRIRTSLYFSLFFLATFAFYVIPPYPAFSLSLGALLPVAETAMLLIAGVTGLYLLARIRREVNPATLRSYNNALLGVTVLLTAFAFLQFDLGVLVFSAALIANRFL
jgi:hypothetical protein